MYVKVIKDGAEHYESTSAGYVGTDVFITMPVESIRDDRHQNLVEVEVTRGDGKIAKAFIEIKQTNVGVNFRLITKRKDAHEQTEVEATARFFKPPFRR